VKFLKAQLEGNRTVQALPVVETLGEAEGAALCAPPDLARLMLK
jgi:hypothetical protein